MTQEQKAKALQRIAKINEKLGAYYESEDSFEQTDMAIDLVQNDLEWALSKLEACMK